MMHEERLKHGCSISRDVQQGQDSLPVTPEAAGA